MNGTNSGENGSLYVQQHNEELAKQKSIYTLEESIKLVNNGAVIKDYQRGKENLLCYNGLLYEKRKNNYHRTCSDCHSDLIVCPDCQKEISVNKDYWWLLGKRIENKEIKNVYTLEEAVKLKGTEIKDFQRGKENLLHYNVIFDILLYEKRKDNNYRICTNCDSEIKICPSCHIEQPYEELWFMLGEGVEKKEGRLEQNIEKKEVGN